MSNMQCESEEQMFSKDCIDSPSVEEASSGGNMEGGTPLKKGPWTSAEDAILVDYVTKHGEGNWNAVQKHSGLSRCGKSCRLRWANHLRPDLKKGAFTAEEECHIIELHAKMGNKWARMAAELPGRTDNEIKNYWNTRIKRRQRAGLPIYPPDICFLKENRQCQNMGAFSPGDTSHPDMLPSSNFEIPAFEFKNLELSQQLYPPAFLDVSASSLLDIPASSLLAQGLDSYGESFLFQAMHPTKRLRESESLLSGLHGSVNNSLTAFSQNHSGGHQKIARSIGFSSGSDHNLSDNQSSSSNSFPGSHALINGNSSSSEPVPWGLKMELPSLQFTDTQVACWGTPSSLLPSLESVDTLILSPPPERTPSECVSPRNSGLLEAVLYESRTLKTTKSNSNQQNSNASIMPNEAGDSLSQNLRETEWDAYGDPISPLGQSAASVFSEYTPTSGNSFDGPQPAETMSGTEVKEEVADWVSMRENDKEEIFKQRPDFLLGSNCFGPDTEHGKDHSILKDAIDALLGEDFCNDCKHIGAAAASSSRGLGHEHGSTVWDNLSTV